MTRTPYLDDRDHRFQVWSGYEPVGAGPSASLGMTFARIAAHNATPRGTDTRKRPVLGKPRERQHAVILSEAEGPLP